MLYKNLLIVLLFACYWQFLNAQDFSNNHKIFGTTSIHYKLNKKSRVSVAYTNIYELDQRFTSFNQFGLRYRHRLGLRSYFHLKGDLIRLKQFDSTSFQDHSKISAAYTHSFRLSKFSLSNGVFAELFLPGFNKYQSRFIYEIGLTYNNKKWPFRLRPYTKFKIYYYQGGNYLSYYDDVGDLIALKAPNDFHRWRWYSGIKFRVLKSLNMSLSYFWNEELNFQLNKNSNINIYNKDKSAIVYPFNSYGAISCSLSYTIKHNKKSKKK